VTLARVREDVDDGRVVQLAYTLRPMSEADVEQVVALHQACYPGALLTAMGPQVLLAVYRSYARSPRCVSLVAEVDGRVVAAVNGAIGEGFVRRIARQHPLVVLVGIARVLATQPRLRELLLKRAVVVWQRTNTAAPAESPARRFNWRSQAVVPAFRGGGLIFPLIKRMIHELQARGVAEIYSTPEIDNQPSMWIHRVLGFRRIGERISENGKQQAVFILPLQSARDEVNTTAGQT
jgi:hypothetical protein